MKQSKRILALVLSLCLLMSLMPAMALGAAAAGSTTLYVQPNDNWKVDGARFAAVLATEGWSAQVWVDATDADGDGVYEVAVPDDGNAYSIVIFCRMNPNNAENGWDNKWNQTSDLTIPTDGTNCYIVEAGSWDAGNGEWTTYTPGDEPVESEPIESEPVVTEPVTPVDLDYCLVGYINGANYGCEEDYENVGEYVFENGTLNATFETNSYIFVKATDNSKWLLAEAYCEDTTCTFSTGKTEKMFVPGGVDLTFTLVENEDGSVTVSYEVATSECAHNYTSEVTTEPDCVNAGTTTYTCSLCGNKYTESIPALGHTYEDTVVPPTCENNGYTVHTCTVCGYHHSTDAVNPIGHDYTSSVIAPTCTQSGYTLYTCLNCGHSYEWNSTAALGHTYVNGTCSTCGEADPDYVPEELDYYLFGYINGADYGIGEDQANLGEYKFVDGKLTVKFSETSYVAVKASDNTSFYMTNGYVGAATSATLYKFTDPYSASANKLEVPGGQTVNFTLTENWDGNLIISYTVDASDCVHTSHNTDGVCTTCGATVAGSAHCPGRCLAPVDAAHGRAFSLAVAIPHAEPRCGGD